jgi:hypothetical protein
MPSPSSLSSTMYEFRMAVVRYRTPSTSPWRTLSSVTLMEEEGMDDTGRRYRNGVDVDPTLRSLAWVSAGLLTTVKS